MELDNGKIIHDLCKKLWPINRSITGDGVRKTLQIIQNELPGLTINEVPTGTQCFDWKVPKEWNIKNAYIIDPTGCKIIDLKDNNLHVVGYSIPIKKVMTLSELQCHLHSLPDQPNAIPYVTSYYKESWGFCLSDNQRQSLVEGQYKVCIDSELTDGYLTYGELIVPGKRKEEILLSTYVCHPSMANNELSGPTVTTYISKWIQSQPREYTYRILFLPETIGSICYISKNLMHLKKYVVAGYVLTCIGDDRAYSYLPSRSGNTLSDKVAKHIFENMYSDVICYTYLDRGSDERQYCSPGVDLPVASLMRSKYLEYPEYHSSLDDLELVTPSGLFGGYNMTKSIIESLECNKSYKPSQLCEPQLGKRNLYPNLSTPKTTKLVENRMNLLAYADGVVDLIDIANILKVCILDLHSEAIILEEAGLLIEC